MNVSARDADGEVARELLRRYYDELNERFPEGFSLETSDVPSDEFRAPRGAFFVLYDDERPVGCGALRLIASDVAEVKRMWIAPTHRSRGLGRLLLNSLEEHALALGGTTVRLDTSQHLHEAIALYVACGYRDVAAYNDNPHAARWFEKSL